MSEKIFDELIEKAKKLTYKDILIIHLERKLEEARKEIRNFILLEIEELKNIRNHTRFPEKSMNRCNRRIKELELKLKEHD